MKYDEISCSEQFQELLKQIPDSERDKVESALKEIVEEFSKHVIKPLESLTKK